MWLGFVLLPLAVLLAIDVSAGSWWARRRRLMDSGVPVTGEVVRVNISVTDFVDPQTRRVMSSSTTMRPVVRFATQSGEPITTSPMRSGVDKFLIPGEPVKIRYSAGNPMRCVVDQRGAITAGMLAGLVVANIFLIGFASVGGYIVGQRTSVRSPAPPTIAQGPGQLIGSGTGSHTTTPTPPVGATAAGAWSAENGPLTVTIVKLVNAGGNVSVTVSAHDRADASVALPTFTYFTATDDQGNTYTAHPLAPITVPAGGSVSDTLTLDQSVPASARSLKVTWTHIYSQDLALNGSITVTGVPLPH
jgi:hypothetical protein